MFTISTNIDKVINDMKRLQQNTMKAERSANKKIAQQTRTQMIKNARERYNVKASDLRNAVDIKSGKDQPTSRIQISTKRIPLINFGAKETKPGVSIMVIKGNRKVIKSSFVPVLKSSHVNVFIRKYKSGKRVGRLPIKQLYGPSPAKMMFNKKAILDAMYFISNKWEQIFKHELDYYNGK